MKLKKNQHAIFLTGAFFVLIILFGIGFKKLYDVRFFADKEMGSFLKTSRFKKIDKKPMTSGTYFADTFSINSSLQEVGSISESTNSHWWVNSGGRFILSQGVGRTIHGDLDPSDPWFMIYNKNNREDTDGGLHPQNIFRLVQTDLWDNFTQQMYFKINKLNDSDSPNKNASNGLFLFNRYATGDNLYYTGLRVDGAVVIKKKINGVYYTMAYRSVIDPYLSLTMWIGLKSEVVTNSDQTVTIRLYTDIGKTGTWTFALMARDNGTQFGKGALIQPGFVGVRTDFMDVEFSDYRVDAF